MKKLENLKLLIEDNNYFSTKKIDGNTWAYILKDVYNADTDKKNNGHNETVRSKKGRNDHPGR